MFNSLSFKALNYKKMILNIGAFGHGNNAKSSTFEMLIHSLGSYVLTEDERLIVK